MPTSVVVLFHSMSGVTREIAGAVSKGVTNVGDCSATVVEIVGQDIKEGIYDNPETISLIDNADGVVFGSPTFMGSVSAQFKAFADATGDLWAENRWSGKVAGGFTVGGNLSGDQMSTLQYLAIFAAQHGMLWCGVDIPGGFDRQGRNRLGAQGGLVAHSSDGTVNPLDLETASYLGQRVATLSKRFKLTA